MLQLDHDLACYVFMGLILRILRAHIIKRQASSQGEKKIELIFFHVNITSDSLIDSYSHESVQQLKSTLLFCLLVPYSTFFYHVIYHGIPILYAHHQKLGNLMHFIAIQFNELISNKVDFAITGYTFCLGISIISQCKSI